MSDPTVKFPFYLETRIEGRRVFFSLSMEPVKIKSIERTAVLERWGCAGPFEFQTRRTVFKSAKKAQDYAALLSAALGKGGFRFYESPDDPILSQVRSHLFMDALQTIGRLAQEKSTAFKCGASVDDLELDVWEKTAGRAFPSSYRAFLQKFNGIRFTPDAENFLYSLREAEDCQAFLSQRSDYDKSKFFPIGESSNREAILITLATPRQEETPVIFHYHDEKPAQWATRFETFADLLICFVENRAARTPVYTLYANAWQPPTIGAEGIID